MAWPSCGCVTGIIKRVFRADRAETLDEVLWPDRNGLTPCHSQLSGECSYANALTSMLRSVRWVTSVGAVARASSWGGCNGLTARRGTAAPSVADEERRSVGTLPRAPDTTFLRIGLSARLLSSPVACRSNFPKDIAAWSTGSTPCYSDSATVLMVPRICCWHGGVGSAQEHHRRGVPDSTRS